MLIQSVHDTVHRFLEEEIIPLPFLSHIDVMLLPHSMASETTFFYSNGRRVPVRHHDSSYGQHHCGFREYELEPYLAMLARHYREIADQAYPRMVVAPDPVLPRFSDLAGHAMAPMTITTMPWLEAAERHWRERNNYHSRMARMAPPPTQQHPYRYHTHDRGYVGLGNIHVPPAPVPQPIPPSLNALRKSFVLLMENLSEAQKQTLLHEGYIDVLSQQKNHYRIFIGSAMNIMQLTKEGVPALFNKNMLCVVPQGSLPQGDVMLCQKLGLELQELVVMNRGNNFTYGVEEIAMKHKYAANDAARIKRLLDNA